MGGVWRTFFFVVALIALTGADCAVWAGSAASANLCRNVSEAFGKNVKELQAQADQCVREKGQQTLKDIVDLFVPMNCSRCLD